MREDCRFCHQTEFKLVLDLGTQPLAGDFLDIDQIGQEKFYPLRIFQCLNCGLVQLRDVVAKEELFQSFLSSVAMTEHFQEYATELMARFIKPGDFVVEIGSNDGVLLAPLQQMGAKVLGVEPVEKIAKLAKQKGVSTRVTYFSYQFAQSLTLKAHLVLANNVFAHIDDLDDVMKGVCHILRPDGYFIFEVQFLIDTIEKLQYDTIYHEHLNYYSVSSLVPFLKKYGLEIVEVKRIPTHAGSIRVYAKKFEIKDFGNQINQEKDKLMLLLNTLRVQGKRVIGYGAAGRANTLLNYCQITPDLVSYIVDESPLRFNRFTPGMHIPVVPPSPQDLLARYILILAWNYKEAIMAKLKRRGYQGYFIVPLPEAKII